MPAVSVSDKQKALFERMKAAQGLFIDEDYTACVTECIKAVKEFGKGASASCAALAEKKQTARDDKERKVAEHVRHDACATRKLGKCRPALRASR